MSAKDLADMAKVAGIPYSSTHGTIEKLRLAKLISARDLFVENDIQRVIEAHAKQLRNDLQMEAPYDYAEYDDYHMREHMTNKPIKDGREVESEAPYSGLLEYGDAIHGVQYVFFRPATWRTWKAYKDEVIGIMRRIFSV